MTTTVAENSLVQKLWEKFLATNPNPDHFAKILSQSMPPEIHRLAAEHLLTHSTKQNLLLLVEKGKNVPEHKERAMEALLSSHVEALSEEDITAIAVADHQKKFAMRVAKIALQRRIKNIKLLRDLICNLPKGSKEQSEVAEAVLGLPDKDRGDVLQIICHFASDSAKERAVQECFAHPNEDRLISIVHTGLKEQKEQAGRLLLDRCKKEQYDSKALGIAYLVLWNVESLNEEAWKIFLSRNPTQLDFAKVAVNAKSQSVRNAAWQKVKADPTKEALREIVRYGSPIQEGAARLLMELPDYEPDDAGLIRCYVGRFAEEARDKLLKAGDPDLHIRQMSKIR